VTKVELLTAMFPGMKNSQFITLDILELRTPAHLTAAALSKNVSNVMVPTSNAFYGSFATIPVKVQANSEFYNANYRISTQFPSRVDKVERLTVTWRQPNNGNMFYDSGDLGRNMFMLRFESEFVPVNPERPESLPTPVPWDGTGERQKLFVLGAIALIGLLVIISIKNKRGHV